jgi:hypothetical protein
MPETDDVGAVIAVHVGQLAGVLIVAASTSGADTELPELKCRLREVSTAGGKRHNDAAIAEADDVSKPVAVRISEFTRIVVLVGPAPGADTEIG